MKKRGLPDDQLYKQRWIALLECAATVLDGQDIGLYYCPGCTEVEMFICDPFMVEWMFDEKDQSWCSSCFEKRDSIKLDNQPDMKFDEKQVVYEFKTVDKEQQKKQKTEWSRILPGKQH